MNLEELTEQKAEETDARVRELLKENAKLRAAQEKRDSGLELAATVLKEVYSAPSGLSVTKPAKSRKKNYVETALLHLTDLHIGKTTSTYNSHVARDRLTHLAEAVKEIVELRRKSAKVDELVVLFGGDFIEGQDIFPGQAFGTDLNVVEQMLRIGPEIVSDALIYLANLFPSIRIAAVPGNHGRVNKNGTEELNADSVLYEIVRGILNLVPGTGHLEWDLPLDRDYGDQWRAVVDVAGHPVLLIHGDSRGGGASSSFGYPWYSVGRKVASWGGHIDFEALYVGHFHSWAEFESAGKLVVATGSIESDNAYAFKNLASTGRPHQRLEFWNTSRRLVSHRLELGETT